MVFLGGIMVVFLYVTTLSNNEKYLKPTLRSLTLMVRVFASLMAIPPVFSLPVSGHLLRLIYAPLRAPVLGLSVSYLLSVLLIAVKITERHKGALVKLY